MAVRNLKATTAIYQFVVDQPTCSSSSTLSSKEVTEQHHKSTVWKNIEKQILCDVILNQKKVREVI